MDGVTVAGSRGSWGDGAVLCRDSVPTCVKTQRLYSTNRTVLCKFLRNHSVKETPMEPKI